MKPLAHFSRKKFQALSPEHQLKAISRLLYSLDERLASPDPQTGLIDNIKDCLAWITPPLPESAQALYAALDTATGIKYLRPLPDIKPREGSNIGITTCPKPGMTAPGKLIRRLWQGLRKLC